ncbi:hypothetical protein K492DRAFT_144761 [Lichtheimia hyalospora FSU 10163]|nr:hypothetical protein K492DRAFT_144761 [Lichtheimia hyalospora FSU 10163]
MVRTKVRWILFELVQDPIIQNDKVVFPRTPLDVSEGTILNSIWSTITANYGDFGNGMSRGIVVKWFNPITRVGIIRVLRDYADMLLASLFFLRRIGDKPCSFRILHVSGTIIAVQRQAILRDKDIYLEEQAKATERGQVYSITDKMEASSKKINELQAFG